MVGAVGFYYQIVILGVQNIHFWVRTKNIFTFLKDRHFLDRMYKWTARFFVYEGLSDSGMSRQREQTAIYVLVGGEPGSGNGRQGVERYGDSPEEASCPAVRLISIKQRSGRTGIREKSELCPGLGEGWGEPGYRAYV
jgi:hypothetical protein